MDWLQALEAIGSLGFTAALIPQFLRTWRRKHAEDVDVTFLVIVLASSLVLLVYAGLTDQFYFAISFTANLVVWGTVLYYRLWPKRAHHVANESAR